MQLLRTFLCFCRMNYRNTGVSSSMFFLSDLLGIHVTASSLPFESGYCHRMPPKPQGFPTQTHYPTTVVRDIEIVDDYRDYRYYRDIEDLYQIYYIFI